MPTCILCLSTVKRFVFMKSLDKSGEVLTLCKKCKNTNPIMNDMLLSHTEDQISDLLQHTDKVKVFKCVTRIKKQKYKNSEQYKLLIKSLLKKDFTQTLIENIHDMSLISALLSYPTKIQWRKMYNNYTVLEFFLLNITDLTVVDLLRTKILNINIGANVEDGANESNILNNLSPSTEPPPYDSLKFQKNMSTPSPKSLQQVADILSSFSFSGNLLLLYKSN